MRVSGVIAIDDLFMRVTEAAHSRSALSGFGPSWNSTRSPTAGSCSAPATSLTLTKIFEPATDWMVASDHNLAHCDVHYDQFEDGEILAMHVIEEIHRRLPETHLVMHGSSSVPQDLQDIINQYGGQMPQTWGVPVEEIQRGIKNGVRKVNIDTDNRMAMTGQIRKILSENPGEFDPRKYLKPARDAMQKLCIERLEAFNTAGQASKIKKIVTLADMAKRYQSGELDPKIA